MLDNIHYFPREVDKIVNYCRLLSDVAKQFQSPNTGTYAPLDLRFVS